MDTFVPDKNKMKDSMGRYCTQSLFLELEYNDEVAVYTLKEDVYEFKGKTFYPIKKLYLEMADPTEYTFANTYLLGWRHWLRLLENKRILKHIEEWREELEVKLRCQGVEKMLLSAAQGNYQAAKWLTDRGWDTNKVGRPKKADIDAQKARDARITDEYGADVHRLFANDRVK